MPRRGSLASHLSSSTNQFEKRQLAHFREALGTEVGSELVDAVLTMTKSLFHSGSGMVEVPAS